GGVDDAEDGEVILHEFGHAIQDAICPDFGQSPEAAAMGEGFGDYFAGSTFAETKPPALRSGVMAWDALPWSSADPPVEPRLDGPGGGSTPRGLTRGSTAAATSTATARSGPRRCGISGQRSAA